MRWRARSLNILHFAVFMHQLYSFRPQTMQMGYYLGYYDTAVVINTATTSVRGLPNPYWASHELDSCTGIW